MMLHSSSRCILRAPPRTLTASSKLLRYPRHRCQSTTATSVEAPPSSSAKISTVPFQFTKEEAEPWLKIGALTAAASLPNFIYSLFIRYFGERFTPILREFGLAGEGLTHLQTKAVLYPIWRYHLAVSGKVTPRGGGKKTTPGDGWAMIDANNLAGNAFSPLCLLTLAPTLPPSLPTFDPSIHLRQLADEPIVQVPFTVQPWTLLQAKREEYGDVVWAEMDGLVDLKNDWKEVLLAVYPIYAPIYIAEYSLRPTDSDAKTRERRITVVMDASNEIEESRVCFPRPAWSRRKGLNATYWWNNPPPFNSISFFLTNYDPPRPLSEASRSAGLDGVAERLIAYFNPPYEASVSDDGRVVEEQEPPASPVLDGDVGEEGVDWKDERVIGWESEDRRANEAWFELLTKREELKGTLETVAKIRDAGRQFGRELKLDLGDESSSESSTRGGTDTMTFTQVRDGLRRKLKEFDERVHKEKPAWLVRWEQRMVSDARERRRKEVETAKARQ